MLGRLRTGEWLAGLGAVVLLVSLLVLHWYGLSLRGFSLHGVSLRAGWYSYAPLARHSAPGPIIPALTGWQAIETLRWFALATVVAGLALVVAQAALRGPALPVTLDLIGMLVAGLTTILLVIRLASTAAPLRFGAFVGLAAAGAVTIGAYQAMRTEAGWDPDAPHPEVPIELVELDPTADGG